MIIYLIFSDKRKIMSVIISSSILSMTDIIFTNLLFLQHDFPIFKNWKNISFKNSGNFPINHNIFNDYTIL